MFVIYLLSPILLYISQNKILNIASHILLGLCWLFVVNCHIEALLFVFLGLDIVKLSPKMKDVTIGVHIKKYVAVSFCLLVIIKVIYMSFFKNETYDIINILLLKCTILVGLPFVYLIIKTMVETGRQKFQKDILFDYYKYSFFTYLFHMLILTVIRNVLELIPGINSFCIYLGTVVGTILISIVLYKILKYLSPGLLSLTVGGRLKG